MTVTDVRVKATVVAQTIKLPFTLDIFGVAVGRDEISLTAEGVDERFPPKTEQRLLQLLVSRARALPH